MCLTQSILGWSGDLSIAMHYQTWSITLFKQCCTCHDCLRTLLLTSYYLHYLNHLVHLICEMWAGVLEGSDWQAGEEVLIGVYDSDECDENFRGENGRACSWAHIAIGEVDYTNRGLVGRMKKMREGNAVYSRINKIPSLPLYKCSHIVLYSSPHKWRCLLLIKTLRVTSSTLCSRH